MSVSFQLIHPQITSCTNVLLIDNSINDAQLFYDSVNTYTFPILYSSSSAKSELLTVLHQLSFVRMGIVFIRNQFLDNQSFFASENVAFIKELGVSHIDFLACDTLNDPEWTNYYSDLFPITVGASNNKTGNIKYGGDWVMESTNEDIEKVYFSDRIQYYKFLLDASGAHILGIRNDGTIWGTGRNNFGQLGLGNTSDNIEIIQITSDISGCTPQSISCSDSHTMVLMKNGTIWGTGLNSNGQLGLGDTTDRNTLTRITSNIGGSTPVFISCGGYHTMVLMTDGTIWGTGANSYFQIYNTSDPIVTTLVQCTDYNILTGSTPKYFSCGEYYTIVLMTNGTIWGNGRNIYGQIGLGFTGTNSTLARLTSDISGCTPLSVSCGANHTMILMTNGTIWGTGLNSNGQLGLGDTTDRNTLTRITSNIGRNTPKIISCGANHTMVLMTDGTIWGTGKNNYGQLGLIDSTDRTTLTQITTKNGDSIPLSISCSYDLTIVLMTDGTIWGTGNMISDVWTSYRLIRIFNLFADDIIFSYISDAYNVYPYSIRFNTEINVVGTNSYQRLYDTILQPSQLTISNKNNYNNDTLSSETLQFYNMSTSLSSSYGINVMSISEPVRYNYSTLSLPINDKAVGYIQNGTGTVPSTVNSTDQILKTLVLGVGIWILIGNCGFASSTAKYHIISITTLTVVPRIEPTCQTRVDSDATTLPVLQCQRFVTNDVPMTYYLVALSEHTTNILSPTVVFQALRIA
jgi:alpha-tubulin suppressor-like RCC1 family protein